MNYREALDFLFNTLPMYQRVGSTAYKKDLTNIIALCRQLGNPQKKFRSIHIAGTNGKGSSAHMLASVLFEAGYKTGLYTSPHLTRFTERIKINGKEIPESQVVKFINTNIEIIREVEPSFFEISVALAFWYFAISKVEIAIVEVGLGGRLDSTNIINPLVSLITNISMDHTQLLGSAVTDIATEKAGIIKENTPVVIGEYDSAYSAVFEEIAQKKQSLFVFGEKKYAGNSDGISDKSGKCIFHMDLGDWPSYQLKNLPGVICSIDFLVRDNFHIARDHIVKGIINFRENTGFKGRWQIIDTKPLTICDTAHNAAGIKVVVDEIRKIEFDNLYVVWGMVIDKDVRSMLRLMPSNGYYYFCKPDIPRGMDAEIVMAEAKKLGFRGTVIPGVKESLSKAREKASNHDLIYIGGSTFVVAELEEIG